MLATPRRIAALLCLTVCAAFGATAGTASAASQSRGLLDLGGVLGGLLGGLTGILNGLLGTAQLAPLTALTSSLTPGSTPSAQTLAPLTSLVQGLSTNASTPADVKAQAASVLGLLNGSSTPLSSDALGQITGLLGSLSLTQGLTSGQVSTLNGLVTAIQNAVGTATGGLPIIGGVTGTGGDPVGSTLVTSLTDLTALLAAGGVPTGASLGPVTALLREVAAGVPEPLRSTITQLADAIDQTVGPLAADLLDPLTTVLGQIAGTSGVSPAAASQLGPLAAALQRSSTTGTPQTTPKPAAKVLYAAAKVSSVKLDRKKGRVTVRVVCQSTTNNCATILTPLRGKSSAGKASLVMLKPGKAATRIITLSKSVKNLMKRKTVKITVVGTSQRGTTNRKSATAKLPKKTKH